MPRSCRDPIKPAAHSPLRKKAALLYAAVESLSVSVVNCAYLVLWIQKRCRVAKRRRWIHLCERLQLPRADDISSSGRRAIQQILNRP